MKKLFVSCMIAFMAICSVGAQEVYIGGGFTVGSEDSEFVLRMLAIRFIRRVLWDCLSMGRLGLLPVTVIPVSGWDCVRDFL